MEILNHFNQSSRARPAALRVAGLFLFYLLVAFALRAPHFGNPVIDIDEQFYLLVGDRMWGGDLPFVDHWDRKPFGLFLIYAATRLLGGEGIVQYQLVAAFFAAGTALLIALTAARFAPLAGAVMAGICYLLWLLLFGGEGGQSPVFYNLPVAGAGALALSAVTRPHFDRKAFLQGCLATFLAGIALQIKYTVIFEGAFFGLALIWAARKSGLGWLRILPAAIFWAFLGLAPTLAVGIGYALMGHGDAFFYANFVAVFVRPQPSGGEAAKRLVHIFTLLLPLLICAVAAWLGRKEASVSAKGHGFVASWAAVAIGGLLAFGTYFNHYALPLLTPLTLAGAPIMANWRSGVGFVSRGRGYWLPFLLFLPAFALVAQNSVLKKRHVQRGTGPEVNTIASQLKARMRPGECIFVFNGEPILYHLTKSCIPTAWSFTDHLSNKGDATGTGVDALAETRRIMAHKPRFVVTTAERLPKANPRTWPFMEAELRRHYRPIYSVRIGKCCTRVIYERRDAAGRLQGAASAH